VILYVRRARLAKRGGSQHLIGSSGPDDRTEVNGLTDAHYAALEDRGVIALSGAETLPFLQGLVTNDVEPMGTGRAIYAALLTPQGKYLHDFILVPSGERILVDCERARLDDLKRRLGLYRLRAKVTIEDVSGTLSVFALFGDGAAARAGLGADPGDARPLDDGVADRDPRLRLLGGRAILPRATGAAALEPAGFALASAGDYRRLRMRLGIGEGGGELGADRTLALETGLDLLNGVSFTKGCYVGQEVTTRMHNRKLVRKRILPVAIEGPAPQPGAPIMLGVAEAGELRAVQDGIGLALLRLESMGEAAKGAALTTGDARIVPQRPEWMKPPD
jgi:folate-binding protein YgfZ